MDAIYISAGRPETPASIFGVNVIMIIAANSSNTLENEYSRLSKSPTMRS